MERVRCSTRTIRSAGLPGRGGLGQEIVGQGHVSGVAEGFGDRHLVGVAEVVVHVGRNRRVVGRLGGVDVDVEIAGDWV